MEQLKSFKTQLTKIEERDYPDNIHGLKKKKPDIIAINF